MRALLILLLCGGLVTGIAQLFGTAFEMRAVETKISAMSRSIDAIGTRARMLEAEWAMLNQPEHLRRLLAAVEEKGLMQTLSPISGEQLIVGAGVIMHRLPPGEPLPEWPMPVARGEGAAPQLKSAPPRQQAAPSADAPLVVTDAPRTPAPMPAPPAPKPTLTLESVLATLEVDS